MSSSETRRMMELCVVRSNLTLVELPLSVLEGLVGGFRGTVVSRKLPKGEGESGGGLHLDVNAGGEEDAGS